MTPRAEQCCWVWREQIASGEGFEKKTTAGCGNADCLNGGVHPTSARSKLWVNKMGTRANRVWA